MTYSTSKEYFLPKKKTALYTSKKELHSKRTHGSWSWKSRRTSIILRFASWLGLRTISTRIQARYSMKALNSPTQRSLETQQAYGSFCPGPRHKWQLMKISQIKGTTITIWDKSTQTGQSTWRGSALGMPDVCRASFSSTSQNHKSLSRNKMTEMTQMISTLTW